MMKNMLCLLSLALATGALASPALPTLPPGLVERAVRTKAPRWKFVDHQRMREIPETFALQVTAAAAYQNPEAVVDGRSLATHLAEKLRFFLVTPEPYPDGSTREPESQGGIGGWTHDVAANALLLAKRTPAVWSQLSADEHADLLAPQSWTKSPTPVFTTSEAHQVYGPGHNSFTTAPDGTDLLVYHARSYRDIPGDPLKDPNRHTRVQPLNWRPDGTPDFGTPRADDRP